MNLIRSLKFGLIITLVLFGTLAEAASLRPDPNVRQGMLANGFHYSIRRNSNPKGGVSLRFGVSIGSYQEEVGERGYAHLVEHMAFRSTRDFPNGGVRQVFERLGVAFGDDQNANTSLTSTRYILDLKSTNSDQVALSFKWLRNVGERIEFDADQLALEREVVLAEKSSTAPTGGLASLQLDLFRRPGLRSGDRPPIGVEADIRGADPSRIQAFYRRWYRPQRSFLAVVGDVDPRVIEPLIVAAFKDWTADRGGADEVKTPLKQGVGPLAFTAVDTGGLGQVEACWLSKPLQVGNDASAYLQAKTRRTLAMAVVSKRALQLRHMASAKILGGSAGFGVEAPDSEQFCVSVAPIGNEPLAAANALGGEVTRLERDGVGEDEMDEAIETIRSQMRGELSGASGSLNWSLANDILSSDLNGVTCLDPADQMRLYDEWVEKMKPGDISATLTEMQFSGPYLSVLSPEPPTPDALLRAWKAGAAEAPKAPFTPRPTPRFAYSFEPVGTIAKREVRATGGYVSMTFQNGVVLNFKHTDFRPGMVSIAVILGQGMKQIKPDRAVEYSIAGGFYSFGGVGKHSRDALAQIFSDVEVRLNLVVTPKYFTISKTVSRNELSNQIMALAAYLSDAAFADLDPLLRKSIDYAQRTSFVTPEFAANQALMSRIDPGGWSVAPSAAQLDKLDGSTVKTLIGPILSDSPITINLVGDIEEKVAIDLVAKTVGAFPARPPLTVPASKPKLLNAAPLAPLYVEHQGAKDRASILLVWPLFVAEPARRKEELTLGILSRIITLNLDDRLRQQSGKVYNPMVNVSLPDDVEQGHLRITIETAPGNIASVSAATHQVVTDLVAGRIPSDQFERAKAPALSASSAQMVSNAYWALTVTEPDSVAELLTSRQSVASITLEDVKAIAAKWLKPIPFEVQALPRKSAP